MDLGCLHLLALANNAARDVGVQISFSSFGHVPRSGIADHMVVLFLIFGGTAISFSIAAAPFYVPTNSAQGFQFLHIPTNTCYFLFFCFVFIAAILMGVRWYLIVVLVSISLMTSWASFHVLIGHLCIFFGEISTEVFGPFLNLVVLLLLLPCILRVALYKNFLSVCMRGFLCYPMATDWMNKSPRFSFWSPLQLTVSQPRKFPSSSTFSRRFTLCFLVLTRLYDTTVSETLSSKRPNTPLPPLQTTLTSQNQGRGRIFIQDILVLVSSPTTVIPSMSVLGTQCSLEPHLHWVLCIEPWLWRWVYRTLKFHFHDRCIPNRSALQSPHLQKNIG